jgi:hypothetical protein
MLYKPHSFHERTHHMQPSIILDLQKEFLTEAISAPKLFRDLGKVEQYISKNRRVVCSGQE